MDHVDNDEWRYWWTRYRWVVFAGAGAVAFVLGVWGFAVLPESEGAATSFLDDVYRAFGLFLLDTGLVSPPVPWQLGIARFLAPLSLAGATIAALWGLLVDQRDQVRALRRRRHLVVCGLGGSGYEVVRSALRPVVDKAVVAADGDAARGDDDPSRRRDKKLRQVTVIEREAAAPAVSAARQLGACVVIGDARLRSVLRLARVERAKQIVVATENDDVNIEIAGAVEQFVADRGTAPGRSGAGPKVAVRVENLEYCRQLQIRELGRTEQVDVDYFSMDQNLAWEFMEKLTRDVDGMVGRGGPTTPQPTIAVVGEGGLFLEVLDRLGGHWDQFVADGRASGPLGVVVSCSEGLAEEAELRPLVSSRLRLERKPVTPDGSYDLVSGRWTAWLQELLRRTDELLALVLCVSDPSVALALAYDAVASTPESDFPVTVAVAEERIPGSALRPGEERGPTAEFDRRVRRIGTRAGALDPRKLGDKRIVDQLARIKHAAYVARHPEYQRWDDLDPARQEDNGDSVRSLLAHLRDEGFGVVYAGVTPRPDPAEYAGRVEKLAAKEHARWVQGYKAQKWEYGDKRDNEAKTHPLLRDWNELNDKEQYETLTEIIELPQLLRRGGYELVWIGKDDDP